MLAAFVLTGCAQIFGLGEPARTPVGDAAVDGTPDSPRADALDAALVLYPCDAAETQLVGCFDFEGSVVDASASATPVVTATNVSFLPGHDGLALEGRAPSMVTLAASTVFDTPSVTIEAWVRPSQLPPVGTRSGVFDLNNRIGVFVQSDGGLSAHGMASSGGLIAANAWTHIAATDDGATLYLYVNGFVVFAAGSTPLGSALGGAEIGGNSPSGDRFVGLIDGLRVYSVARSAGDIAADASR